MKTILKRNLKEILRELKLKKQVEYQDRVNSILSEKQPHLTEVEKRHIVEKAGCLALNVAGIISITLNANLEKNNEKRALKYLEDIQASDGTLRTDLYTHLTDAGVICKDGYSLVLIWILSDNYVDNKEGLSFIHALPDNLDDKPYKDDYLEFCKNSTKEIMKDTIKIIKEKLAEEESSKLRKTHFVEQEDVATEKNQSSSTWVERTASSPSTKKVKFEVGAKE